MNKNSIPNALTYARIAVCPLLVPLYFIPGDFCNMVLLAICAFAIITDFLDGFLARLWKVESDIGRALDPIGDKLLVGIALMLLISDATAHIVPAIMIMFREVFISGLRESLANNNVVIHVSTLAKWKTATQMAAILLLFIAHGSTGDVFYWLGNIALWASAVLTLYTGWEYWRSAWENFK